LIILAISAFGSIDARAAPIKDIGTKITSKKVVFAHGIAEACWNFHIDVALPISIGSRNVALATDGGIPSRIIRGSITNEPPLAAEFKKPQITPKKISVMIIEKHSFYSFKTCYSADSNLLNPCCHEVSQQLLGIKVDP